MCRWISHTVSVSLHVIVFVFFFRVFMSLCFCLCLNVSVFVSASLCLCVCVCVCICALCLWLCTETIGPRSLVNDQAPNEPLCGRFQANLIKSHCIGSASSTKTGIPGISFEEHLNQTHIYDIRIVNTATISTNTKRYKLCKKKVKIQQNVLLLCVNIIIILVIIFLIFIGGGDRDRA